MAMTINEIVLKSIYDINKIIALPLIALPCHVTTSIDLIEKIKKKVMEIEKYQEIGHLILIINLLQFTCNIQAVQNAGKLE
ncbi:hypothetical protein T03_17156 [Trichinella britovi]|uniref:Uncharacterized protein n=1 Tax=Trichinella britovi TaxID=45882 RepID=A0A0V1CXX4_TRIBR|nr:hypothetical protein T03_17156 [Trichinella britovi]